MAKRRSKEKIKSDRREIIKLILQENKYKDRYLDKHKDRNFYVKYKNIFYKDINESLIKNIENTDYVEFISSYKNFLIDNRNNIDLFTKYLENFDKIKCFFNQLIKSESSYYKNQFIKNLGQEIEVEVKEFNKKLNYKLNFLEFIKLSLNNNNKEKKPE